MSIERERVQTFGKLENGLRQASDWYLWGPYVSERQWGTVREDYSEDGEAWNYLPHDHARLPRIAGVRTAWPAFAISNSGFASDSLSGTDATRSSRNGSLA